MKIFDRKNLYRATASVDLVEAALSQYPDVKHWLNASYTDYGGSPLDVVWCRVGREIGLCEDTIHNGENALIPLTEIEKQQIEEYPLTEYRGIDTEELYAMLEGETFSEATQYILDDLDIDQTHYPTIYDTLLDIGTWETTYIDYDYDELINKLKQWRILS